MKARTTTTQHWREVQDEHAGWSDVVDEEETGGMTTAAGSSGGVRLDSALGALATKGTTSTTTTAIDVLRRVVTDLMADIREYDRTTSEGVSVILGFITSGSRTALKEECRHNRSIVCIVARVPVWWWHLFAWSPAVISTQPSYPTSLEQDGPTPAEDFHNAISSCTLDFDTTTHPTPLLHLPESIKYSSRDAI
jgi:hypothetical protein